MSHVIDRLHQKLVHVLIEQDKADERREIKRGYAPNIYRLSHLLRVAQEVKETTEANGGTLTVYADAMMHHFNPSPRIRTFLKKNVDENIDVVRGRWVVKEERY